MRYGLIGCGRFGQFCLEALRSPFEPVAAADLDPSLAARTGLPGGSPGELLARPEVEMVHIATPPWTHYELTRAALLAGKHVLCEKPLALTLEQAEELVTLASEKRLRLAVNHLLRYSELLQAVKRILDSEVLGKPLHAFFENYAQNEHLPPDHWFWDPERSGGIFIEHGVHFFDLHRWWFGPGQVLASVLQPQQVSCLALHGEVNVHSYHGFTQPARLDRADHRIVCERGDLRIAGWIPETLEVHGLADLSGVCPWTSLSVHDGETRARWQLSEEKAARYAEMFRMLLRDQFASTSMPRLSATDALEAVRVACQATERGVA